MSFEEIVNYIENYNKILDDDWRKIVDDFILQKFKLEEATEKNLLFYILIMINIKKITYSENTENIHKLIIEHYKNNKLIMGLQITKWYENEKNIKECIEFSLNEINYTIKQANYDLLEYLIGKDKLSQTVAELIEYLARTLMSKDTFDFNLYKKMNGVEKHKSKVCKYITSSVVKDECEQIFLGYVNSIILLYETNKNHFELLDEAISFYVKKVFSMIQIITILDAKFSEMFGKPEVDSNIEDDYIGDYNYYIKKMKDICIRDNIDFVNTKTCKELMYFYIFKSEKMSDDEDKHIFVDYLYKNKENVLTDKMSFDIINAYNSGKIVIKKEDIDKIKNMYQEEQTELLDKINNLIRLTNEEKDEFKLLLNRMKILKGVIPYNMCRYVIYCILKFNEFEEMKDCILCDFATNIEHDNKVYNIMNYIEEINETRVLNNEAEYMEIDAEITNCFSNQNVEAINTIFHKIEHIIQDKDISEEKFEGNRYYMYVEKKLAEEIKEYDKLNYYNKYSEIEARLVAANKLSEFLDDINIDKKNCFIANETAEDYIDKMITECNELLKKANMKKISENEEKDIMDIWKSI